jgi:hypothetical protein
MLRILDSVHTASKTADTTSTPLSTLSLAVLFIGDEKLHFWFLLQHTLARTVAVDVVAARGAVVCTVFML